MASQKRKALILDLGGAPATPHFIPGVPGHFRPHVPTPVGEEGEISLEDAKRFAKERDTLKLIDISAAEAKKAKQFAEETEGAIRRGLKEAATVAEGAEPGLIEDETVAADAAESE